MAKNCEICGVPSPTRVSLPAVKRGTLLCATCASTTRVDLAWVAAWVGRFLVARSEPTRAKYGNEATRFVLHLHRLGLGLEKLTPSSLEDALLAPEYGYMIKISRKQTWKLKKTIIRQFLDWVGSQAGAPYSRIPTITWPSAPREERVVVIPSPEIARALLLAPMEVRTADILQPDRRYNPNPNTRWRDTVIITLPMMQGLRANELAGGLRVPLVYVRSDGGVARTIREAACVGREITIIGKGNKERVVEPTTAARQVLDLFLSERNNYRLDDPRVITLSVTRIRAIFSQYARFVGAPAQGIHSLRHYFATNWYLERVKELLAGGSTPNNADTEAIADLSKILGHSSPRVTEAYVHERLRVRTAHLAGQSLPAELLDDYLPPGHPKRK